jgi:hypothetical protein
MNGENEGTKKEEVVVHMNVLCEHSLGHCKRREGGDFNDLIG